MILGMTVETFTRLHVVLSLVAIGAGFVVLFGMLTGRVMDRWTLFFLITTTLTSLTGFAFPFRGVQPGHVIGILSLIALTIAIVARYSFRLAGAWRSIYVVGAVASLYLNVFVAVFHAFLDIPALQPFAPTKMVPPFMISELVVLVAFVMLTVMASRRFQVQNIRAT